jgi:hypothetical protein
MSTVPLAAVMCPSLADAVDEALAEGLAGRNGRCLWCGAPTTAVVADIWSGRAALTCSVCGSELSGTVPRPLREVRR